MIRHATPHLQNQPTLNLPPTVKWTVILLTVLQSWTKTESNSTSAHPNQTLKSLNTKALMWQSLNLPVSTYARRRFPEMDTARVRWTKVRTLTGTVPSTTIKSIVLIQRSCRLVSDLTSIQKASVMASMKVSSEGSKRGTNRTITINRRIITIPITIAPKDLRAATVLTTIITV